MDALESFLDRLPEEQKFAFVFRDRSWLDEEVYEFLRQLNSVIVWQSSGTFPDDCIATAGFIYIRFHGLAGGYTYSYSREDLKPWAEVIKRHMDEGKGAHLYYNNTGGNAPESAKMMRKLLA